MRRASLRLTTKLLTLEVVVFTLTLTAFILTTLAYLQDSRWDYEERAVFRAKYEFWHRMHKAKKRLVHAHVGDKVEDDGAGHLKINSRTPVHTDPKEHFDHHIHDHQFSPRYEGTAITSIVLTCLACIACAVELGLSFCYKNARVRRITNGTIHLCIAWALLTSTNINCGQLIKTNWGYSGGPNVTNEWITIYFQGCRIGQQNTAWAASASKVARAFDECLATPGHTVDSFTYPKQPSRDTGLLVFEECYKPAVEPTLTTRHGANVSNTLWLTSSRNNLSGTLPMKEYAYQIGVCQLWIYKLCVIILNFIALLCSIAIVRSAFRVYRPGEVAPDEVVPEEEQAFVQVWVDDSIDDDEVLEFVDAIEEQEKLDEEPTRQPRPSELRRRHSHHSYYIHAEEAASGAAALDIVAGTLTQPTETPAARAPAASVVGAPGPFILRRHSVTIDSIRERSTLFGKPARLSPRGSVDSASGPVIIRKSVQSGGGLTRRRHSRPSVIVADPATSTLAKQQRESTQSTSR